MYLVLYSVLFTGLPPLVLGILDQSAPDYILAAKPSLYSVGRNSTVLFPSPKLIIHSKMEYLLALPKIFLLGN